MSALARAGAVADGRDRHRRHGAEAGRQRGEDGGAGRRGQLAGLGTRGDDGVDRTEEFGSGRHGDRHHAVLGADGPASDGDGRAGDLGDAEHLQTDAGAGDVDDGVDRADFVEMDAVGRGAVDLGLGVGQPAEDAFGGVAGAGGDVGGVEDADDVAQPALGVGVPGIIFTSHLVPARPLRCTLAADSS